MIQGGHEGTPAVGYFVQLLLLRSRGSHVVYSAKILGEKRMRNGKST